MGRLPPISATGSFGRHQLGGVCCGLERDSLSCRLLAHRWILASTVADALFRSPSERTPCTIEVLDGKRHFDWYGHTNGREIAPGVPVSEPKFCATCQAAGVQRAAHRIMPGGRGLCDEHFRAERGIALAIIDSRGRKPGEHWKPGERAQAKQFLQSGESLRDTAEKTGLAKGTVQNVRDTVKSEIPNCGCGRPGDHRGRCMYRRQKAEPTNGNTPIARAPRKARASGFLEILEEKLQSLKSQKAELEENIRAIETTLRILDYEKTTPMAEKRD